MFRTIPFTNTTASAAKPEYRLYSGTSNNLSVLPVWPQKSRYAALGRKKDNDLRGP